MAKTFGKTQLKANFYDDAFLAVVAEELPEAASQTFVDGAPVVFASGYISTAANPVTAVCGFALQAAHNSTAGAYSIKIVPAFHGITVCGNVLDTAAADYVLLATDLGTAYRLALSSTLLGSASPGWYILATASTQACKIVSFKSDVVIPNQSSMVAAAGDTNARVTASVLSSVMVGAAGNWL